MTASIAHPVAAATSCGRYDCGHVGRSSSPVLKRAAVIYLSSAAGVPVPPNESADVMAVVAMMRRGVSCSEVAESYRDPSTGQFAGNKPVPATTAPLTFIEREILAALASGASIPEVADQLGRKTQTVRSHLTYAMRRTGTHSTLDAIVVAVQRGEISL